MKQCTMACNWFQIPARTLLFLFLATLPATGQEREKIKPYHSIGVNIGHEYSFSGVGEDGKKKLVVLPYWGLDYNFTLSEKFALGLHTDFIAETFQVEKNIGPEEDEVTERTRPIAPALMGFYKPSEHWSLGLGAGREFSKEESYWLNRLAIEYGAEIRKGWEVFGVFQYDIRWNAYDTWTIGLGISKAFRKK